MAAASEAYLSSVTAALARLQGNLAEIERTNDWKTKRALIELLVPRMMAQTEVIGTTLGGRRRKKTTLLMTLAYSNQDAVVSVSATAGKSIT